MIQAKDLSDSLVAYQLSSSRLNYLYDVCVMHGRKGLLCANERTVFIYASSCMMEGYNRGENRYHLYQIFEVPFISSDITSLCWCKSENTGMTNSGSFAIATSTEVVLYSPMCFDFLSGEGYVMEVCAFWSD